MVWYFIKDAKTMKELHKTEYTKIQQKVKLSLHMTRRHVVRVDANYP